MSVFFSKQMALMKHRGLFEFLEKHGRVLLDTKMQTASHATRIAIITMLEELAPNLWEDDLNRLVDFGHIISPALEMVPGPFVVVLMRLYLFGFGEYAFSSVSPCKFPHCELNKALFLHQLCLYRKSCRPCYMAKQ